MLIRGQTTEERIAGIAKQFANGIDGFTAGMRMETEANNAAKNDSTRAEALRRQQALQEMEIEGKLSEQTGKSLVGSGIGKQYLSGGIVGIGDLMKSAPMTRKAELEAQDRQVKADDRAIDNRYKESQINKNNRDPVAKNGGLNLTKGDESADREYGKNYNNFISKGIVNSESSIKRLEKVADELEKDQGFMEASGTKIPIPDWARSSDAIRRREAAKNAAFSTIKELLPGSVSDSDREAVTRDYYNDQLGAKENAAIIREKVQQLKSIRQLEMQKAQHFGANGTLKGFQGTLEQQDSVGTKQAAPGKAPWEKYKK